MTNWHPDRSQLLAFLSTQDLCVLSTLDANGNPSGATVAFSATPGFELMIGTSRTSRKFANLIRHPCVAVTATDPERRLTMQFQGRARQLLGAELAAREAAHYAKLPGSLPFKDQPDETFFLLTPTHIQFSDCAPQPWRVARFTF